MPPTVARYVENRKAVALSKSTLILRSVESSFKPAIVDATPASTAFSAEMASVCLRGEGKYGLPVLAVEKLTSAMCARLSTGNCSLTLVSSCCKADRVPLRRAFARGVSPLWLIGEPSSPRYGVILANAKKVRNLGSRGTKYQTRHKRVQQPLWRISV